MFYLLEPSQGLKWTDLPTSLLTAIRRESPDIDLSKLDWRDDAGQAFTSDLLELALRRGIACSVGLVVEGGDVYTLNRPEEIRSSWLQAKQTQETLRETRGPLMERLMPGWTASGEDLDQRVDASVARTLEEAQEEASELVSGDRDERLAAHWLGLGGLLPSDHTR